MIFVSGTKRSGTSMWMQVLAAAGAPILGAAFPRGWGRTIREANEGGFFESILREGIYYRTNPHPVTGDYFLPEHVDGYAVKVFVPGVIRSERAYIHHLLANVREWREYDASVRRLYALERAAALARDPGAPEPPFFPPVMEWWMENFALIRDISLRRYPARLYAYDRVLAEPERILADALAFIGLPERLSAALDAIKPERRSQHPAADRPELTDAVEPELTRVFDDLYAAVAQGRPLTRALLATLNDTNKRLLPRLTEHQRQLIVAHQAHQAATKAKRPPPEPILGLPTLRPPV
ncbi:MAG: hypothetical protein IPK80_07090 [Nannocystis sp.]|nr:hypothetical protein [Nannocystis sp.]